MRKFLIWIFAVTVVWGMSLSSEAQMRLSSPDFVDNGLIPRTFSCQGEDVNPALNISDVPKTAQSLALIVDDPDAPMGTWVHWVVFDIPVSMSRIERDSVPGIEGANDFGRLNWGGPCPPSGTHRYFFKLYALDKKMDLGGSWVTKKSLLDSMEGHVLAEAQTIGLYKKVK